MRPSLVLLLDLSVLLSLGVRDKLDLARRIADRLGPDFLPGEELVGQIGLPGLVHAPTGAPFVIPPTGQYEMGFTDRDREALRAAVRSQWVDAFADDLVHTSRPVRAVRVKPFVVSVRPLRLEEVSKVQSGRSAADTFLRADAIHFVEATGCRLPSEAELEWLAREGGRHSFAADGCSAYARDGAFPEQGEWGIERLTRGEWAADDWHDDYHGAPDDSSPWLRGDPRGAYRGSLPFGVDEDPSEVALGLACNRGRNRNTYAESDGVRFMVRLARDIPEE
jgi:formylglycine-generating enzyme required for sulfatase activity